MEAEEKDRLCHRVGTRVRALREERGMSREGLAEAVGISTQYVSDIEQGKKCMSMAILVDVCRLFRVSLDEMVRQGPGMDDRVAQVAEHLRSLSPVERDLAAGMILSAARAVEALVVQE